MTPKDALIEKMARAIYSASPYVDEDYTVIPWEELGNVAYDNYRRKARAAYEAEHEETKG